MTDASPTVDGRPAACNAAPETMPKRQPEPPPKPSPRRPPLPPPEFGAFVRQHREAAGITTDALGAYVQDSGLSIANIERAVRAPYQDDDRIAALAAPLGVDADDLVVLARQCRPSYSFHGAGMTQAHRDVAHLLQAHWGEVPDKALAKATRIAGEAPNRRDRIVPEPSAFGEWLLDKRLNSVPMLSQPDVGEAVGVARSYVSMVEGGVKGVSWPEEAIDKAAALFHEPRATVRALAARSRQRYDLVGREASLAHRALAAVLEERWTELPRAVLDEIAEILSRATKNVSATRAKR